MRSITPYSSDNRFLQRWTQLRTFTLESVVVLYAIHHTTLVHNPRRPNKRLRNRHWSIVLFPVRLKGGFGHISKRTFCFFPRVCVDNVLRCWIVDEMLAELFLQHAATAPGDVYGE